MLILSGFKLFDAYGLPLSVQIEAAPSRVTSALEWLKMQEIVK